MQIRADVEKLILLELQREYFDVWKTFRLKFTQAQIVLFDSKSKWGEYDSFANTISISRKLVFEQNWLDVIGVLKHEIAHQIVFNKYGSDHAAVCNHGSEFREACYQIRLDRRYQSAQLEIINENSDFLKLDETFESTPLVEKIKKLLSLAQSDNEHESKMAAAKVRQLYLKYNIEEIGIEKNFETKIRRHVVPLNKKNLSTFDKKLIGTINEFYFVKSILIQTFNVKTARHETAIEFFGLIENILMAEYVLNFLNQSSESCWFKNQQIIHSKIDKESFKIGFIDGFYESLSVENTNSSPIVDVSSQRQLALATHKVQTYLEDCYPRIKSLRSRGRKISKEHYQSGKILGQQTKVSKPVESSSSNKIRFLGFKK
ncbi:MAG: SprT-like domain-containing protein [Pseudobdellovibrio sp.]